MATKEAPTKDPVCGMDVDKADCVQESHAGKEYYFCGEECCEKFMEDPDKFIGKKNLAKK
ncbi:MAG: YHS domain-containing protein [Planctomycetes bacterium]|jgi:Cu+-exporting ATPase|nr:YHS domain-containing protein [Planctomycetota bacterium]